LAEILWRSSELGRRHINWDGTGLPTLVDSQLFEDELLAAKEEHLAKDRQHILKEARAHGAPEPNGLKEAKKLPNWKQTQELLHSG